MGSVEDEYYDDVTPESEFPAPFSDDIVMYVELSIITLTGTVALFGTVSNVINMCVFVRQGILSHSSVVTLSAITIADGCACFLFVLVLIPTYIRYLVDYKGWTWDVEYFELYVIIRPTNTFTQITCLATAYLTFERVAGAVFPFKTKRFFTPKRSLVGMVCLFVFVFILHIPNNYTVIPSWEKKATNVTVPIPQWHILLPQELSEVFFYASPVTLRFASVAVVVVCNCVLWWKIRQSNKFRKWASTAGRSSTHAQSQSPLPSCFSQLATEETGTALAVATILPLSQQSMINTGSRSHLSDGDMKYSIVDERKAGERRKNTSVLYPSTTTTDTTKSVNLTNTHNNNNENGETRRIINVSSTTTTYSNTTNTRINNNHNNNNNGEKRKNIRVISATENTAKPVKTTSTRKNLNRNHNNNTSNNSNNNNRNNNKSNNKNNNSTRRGNSSSSSYPAKDMALLRMIVVISSVFTVCYTVYVVAVIVLSLELTLMEDYHIYINYIVWDIVSLFQSINGSINVLIYYRMSSRFRQELHQMCRRI